MLCNSKIILIILYIKIFIKIFYFTYSYFSKTHINNMKLISSEINIYSLTIAKFYYSKVNLEIACSKVFYCVTSFPIQR